MPYQYPQNQAMSMLQSFPARAKAKGRVRKEQEQEQERKQGKEQGVKQKGYVYLSLFKSIRKKDVFFWFKP